jgi:hypothetical protein
MKSLSDGDAVPIRLPVKKGFFLVVGLYRIAIEFILFISLSSSSSSFC